MEWRSETGATPSLSTTSLPGCNWLESGAQVQLKTARR
jgi:hypothetical protein